MRIGLTYDLREEYLRAGYSEFDTAEFDRPDTIDAIEKALQSLHHEIVRIGHIRQLVERLNDGHRWDLVFNLCEGLYGYGREAQVPALLDAYGIPYTFSDPLAATLSLHKAMAKHVVRDRGIPTPDFTVVEAVEDLAGVALPFPLFAKPLAEGTSKGVTAASKIVSAVQLSRICRELLRAYRQPVLVETFLPGREFTVGILGSGARTEVLGTLEVRLRECADAEVYSYRNKEHCEELVDYALLHEQPLRAQVESQALAAWRVLGCRDAGRIDIRLDGSGRPQFLEANPLAGLHPTHSDLPIIAALVGVSYHELIGRIMESAQERCARRRERRKRVCVA